MLQKEDLQEWEIGRIKGLIESFAEWDGQTYLELLEEMTEQAAAAKMAFIETQIGQPTKGVHPEVWWDGGNWTA